MVEISIGKVRIGEKHPAFIIAEAGVNHILEKEDLDSLGLSSSLEVAFKLVDCAVMAKANAIKFQSFNAKLLQYQGTQKPQYQINNVGDEVSYFELLKKLETSQEDQIKIKNYCDDKGIIFLSTPYDNENVDFLDDIIKVPAFKLASIELNNHLLLKHVGQKNKPLIISSGLSTDDDVSQMFNFADKSDFSQNIILLHCNSDYPTPTQDINLNVIHNFKEKYPNNIIGFSDHSETNIASLGAVSLGAKVLERHFTMNRNFNGPDHRASLNPEELTNWVKEVRIMEKSMGEFDKVITPSEKKNISMRKFLVICPLKKGQVVNYEHLTSMRTGEGVLPRNRNIKKIIGKKVTKDIEKTTPFDWNMI